MSVAGTSFPLSAESFNLGPVQDGSNDCVGGVIADDSAAQGMWILGDVFLENVYTCEWILLCPSSTPRP